MACLEICYLDRFHFMLENCRCTNQLIEAQHHRRYNEDQEEQLSNTSQHIENYNDIATNKTSQFLLPLLKAKNMGK